jgi:hypothetical protein
MRETVIINVTTPTHSDFAKHLFREQAESRFDRKPASVQITEVDMQDPEMVRMFNAKAGRFHRVTQDQDYTKGMLGVFARAYGGSEVKTTPETTTEEEWKQGWELVKQKYPEYTNQEPTLKRIPIPYSRDLDGTFFRPARQLGKTRATKTLREQLS